MFSFNDGRLTILLQLSQRGHLPRYPRCSPVRERRHPQPRCDPLSRRARGFPPSLQLSELTPSPHSFHGDLNATCEWLSRRRRGPRADFDADPVGEKVSDENKLLIKTARKCLDEAIRACKPGMEYGKLGNIIEPIAVAQGFSVNRTYVGHGINSCAGSLLSVAMFSLTSPCVRLFHCAPNVSVSLFAAHCVLG